MASQTMKATYYTVPESGNPDFGSVPCCSYVFTSTTTGEVTDTLGINGLPVYNTSFGGPALSDVDGSTGELLWWSSKPTGSAIVNLPINQTSFFPANGGGSDDGSGFQTAIYRGKLIVPNGGQTITFNLSSDDDSFLALDNTIIAEDGGVHPLGAGTSVTETLAQGSYSLTIFFADRHTVASALQFSAPDANIIAVPEPATWTMLIMGVAMIGFAARRRVRATVA